METEAPEQRAAKLYDACHPGDSFGNLERRAVFSKEDRMLLRDWLAAAARQLTPTRSCSEHV